LKLNQEKKKKLLPFKRCRTLRTRKELVWMAIGTSYWNLDTLETEEGRKAHLAGKIAEKLHG
jgi:hypothetical protein